MNRLKKILCAVLSVCIVSVPVFSAVVTAGAEDVETLQQRLENLDKKSKEYQEILEKTQNDISEKEEYSDTLVSKIKVLNEKVILTRESMNDLEKSITETQADIDAKNAEIESQVDALCDRLRAIYMAGSASDLEIILGAKDFSDFIDKMTLVKNLSKYDKELIDEINGKLEVITEKKTKLEADKQDLEVKEASLKADLEEYNNLLEENKEILKDLYDQNDEAKDFLANADNKQAQIEAQIAKYFEEQAAAARKAAQEAANRQTSDNNSSSSSSSSSHSSSSSSSESSSDNEEYSDDSSSGGSTVDPSPSYTSGYTWPVPGFYYLSSEWNEDRYTYNHGAIDIAGAGIMGAPVVAADNGTVLYTNTSCYHNWGKSGSCGCGGGYGNYVWLSHGNGKETIYAHLTSLIVSPGEYVTKGQVIGYVGTTGYSTGPHLHFECRYNGVKYNPMTEF